jgi:4-carboxymuconolactone decarboxylase
MSKHTMNPEEILTRLGGGDMKPLLFLLRMHEGAYEESGLDPRTFTLVRLAALASVEAAPASWLVNVDLGGEAGIEPATILGTLIAIAPVIGTARVVSAATSIVGALDLKDEIAEEERH